MAKSSKEALGALGQSNVLLFDPDSLTIVEDKSSAIFDSRGLQPPPEALICNIKTFGILEPVLVRKNPETGKTEVIAGRRRVLAAREANRRLKAEGGELLRVPAIAKRASDALATSMMAIENAQREEDSPLGKATTMQKLLDHGKSEDEIALIYGCSKATVKNTLALLECTAVVKNAIQSGKVGITTAYELSRLEPEEQRKKLDAMVAAGEGQSGKKRARAMREASGKTSRPGKKEILGYLEYVEGHVEAKSGDPNACEIATALLKWILGEGSRPRMPKATR